MRTLVAVAKVKSFNGAARSLGISGSLVSRHIAHLEHEIGVRLVNRTARSVTLTEAGERYTAFATRILGEIAEEDATLAGLRERAEGTLNVISPKWIGSLDLGEAIAQFAIDHPLINVRFEVGGMSDRTYNFIDSGFDVAFHTKHLRDSSVKVKKIADLKFVLCAAPAYLAKRPELTGPRDLADHNCLVHVNDPVWHFKYGSRSEHVKVAHPVFTSNTYLVLQKATLRGLGIALLPLRPIYQEVLDGRLRVLLSEHAVPDRPLFAVYPPGRQPLRKVKVFLDFIRAWFTEHPMLELPETVSPAPTRVAAGRST
ncbi:MAG TPA: LysR family transcriptional regulator [Gaiellaceae bacterium]|nr:LysR family transcriptional regulator [Gaiellaceae bacterium]